MSFLTAVLDCPHLTPAWLFLPFLHAAILTLPGKAVSPSPWLAQYSVSLGFSRLIAAWDWTSSFGCDPLQNRTSQPGSVSRCPVSVWNSWQVLYPTSFSTPGLCSVAPLARPLSKTLLPSCISEGQFPSVQTLWTLTSYLTETRWEGMSSSSQGQDDRGMS